MAKLIENSTVKENLIATELYVDTNLSSHAGNNVIHITAAERTAWNSKGTSNLTIGETSLTAYRGDRGKIAYDHSQTAHAPSTAQKNSDITKAEIEAKLTGAITSHTHSYVGLSGAQTVAGVKTFSSIPVLPASDPTTANQATRKSYVDAQVATKAALGETSSTAYRGDRGKIAYDHSQTAHAPSTAQKNSDITKAEIEAKLTGDVTTHTHSYSGKFEWVYNANTESLDLNYIG